MGLFDFLFKTKSNSKTTIPEKLEQGNAIEIKLNNLNLNQIKYCKKGDSVKFWNKPDSNEIFIYRGGTIGGQGYMGKYEGVYKSLLMHHIKLGDQQFSEILRISSNSITIKFWIKSLKELEKEAEKMRGERGLILEEMLKSLPKKKMKYFTIPGALEILDRNREYKKGELFQVKLMDKDFYLNNQNEMDILMIDNKGNEVMKYSGRHYDTRFFNLLRYGFNGYKLEAEIINTYQGMTDELRINILYD